MTSKIPEMIRFPITAKMERLPNGRYQITDAAYADVPFDAVVRIFWQAYRADQETMMKGAKTA